jgi:hypothetical protein
VGARNSAHGLASDIRHSDPHERAAVLSLTVPHMCKLQAGLMARPFLPYQLYAQVLNSVIPKPPVKILRFANSADDCCFIVNQTRTEADQTAFERQRFVCVELARELVFVQLKSPR